MNIESSSRASGNVKRVIFIRTGESVRAVAFKDRREFDEELFGVLDSQRRDAIYREIAT